MNTTLRTVPSIVLSLLVLVVGCAGPPEPERVRTPWSLDELAVVVRDDGRGFFYTDKGGAVLEGQSGHPMRWSLSVDGVEIASGVRLEFKGAAFPSADSALIAPDRVKFFQAGGVSTELTLLDARDRTHVLLVDVAGPGAGETSAHLLLASHFSPVRTPGHASGWESRSAGLRLMVLASPPLQPAPESRPTGGAGTRFVVAVCPLGTPAPDMAGLLESSDSLRDARRERMERLLNTMYLRSSDSLVTRAVRWAQLSLDALLIEREDTVLIPGLPWQGEVEGRSTAQAIAGLDLATGRYRSAGALLRFMANLQDTVRGSTTYGRIPERAGRNGRTYAGADVTPWFVREMYDHISRSNDTALARQLFPAVARSVEGTMATSTDSSNLLVHGDFDTWMNPRGRVAGSRSVHGSPRGNRAAEVQALWYFQQTAASYLARFVKDWKRAERWDSSQAQTVAAFNAQFVDTTGLRIADHLRPDGRPVFEERPNGLLCLDVVWYDAVRTETVNRVGRSLLYSFGVGTLSPDSPSFRPLFGTSADNNSPSYDGAVSVWLTGHAVYALTRYDQQDFSYRITAFQARSLLDGAMVGALPEAFDAVLSGGAGRPHAAGRKVSAPALAEFVRSLYQDYLGVRIDRSSNVITVAPKLPAQYSHAEFSVFVGESEVYVVYELHRERPRLRLYTSPGAEELKVQVLWTMAGGDGWRGSFTLPPDAPTWVEFGEDEAVVNQNGRSEELAGQWRIRNFSRRSDLTGLSLLSVSHR